MSMDLSNTLETVTVTISPFSQDGFADQVTG